MRDGGSVAPGGGESSGAPEVPGGGEGGALYVVATPIGNLGDLSPRAREILASCDILACEDTRTAGRLLTRCGVETTASKVAYHEHNEARAAPGLAAEVAAGKAVALVSDAGTPALSDPGFRLVRACRAGGLRVVPVPGPSAPAAALAASGLPTDGYFFAGFLAPKRAARRRFFERYRDFPHTLVLFESCHRIGKCLEDLEATLGGDRCIAVAREMTKLHETFHAGPAQDVRREVAAGSQKGEFVVLVAKEGYRLDPGGGDGALTG